MAHFNESCGCRVCLGTFDGLHLGHKSVICAPGCRGENIVLMFRAHPQKTLTGEAPCEITTKTKQERLLFEWGARAEYLDFEEICDLTPEEFFKKILLGRFGAESVSCGFNYRFGKDGAGDVEVLKKLCIENGVGINICEPVLQFGQPVSSTRIRKAISDGDMPCAAAMLGRLFSYDFEVVHGDARGRLLGFPTINQFFDEGFAVPAYGVYASVTEIGGKTYPSVTNIGIRPTVGNSRERSETHIIGFEGDLYGKTVEVSLIKKLRDELKFSTFDELKTQMAEDKRKAVAESEDIV